MVASVTNRMQRSLAALKSHYERLRYLALLGTKGHYAHWGMSRRYGKQATEQGLLEVHRAVFDETLLTPLQRLDQEEAAHAGSQPLNDRTSSLAPKGSRFGARLHFRWLSECLQALRRRRL
jgi:hypothetical protein